MSEQVEFLDDPTTPNFKPLEKKPVRGLTAFIMRYFKISETSAHILLIVLTVIFFLLAIFFFAKNPVYSEDKNESFADRATRSSIPYYER